MNKKAKRRAFFICLAICLMNLSLALKITDRFNIKRIDENVSHRTNDLSIMSSKIQEEKQEKKIVEEEQKGDKKEVQNLEATEKKVFFKNMENEVEPLFFITIPILCHMIKNKVLEQELLIPSSNNAWKKPFQIIRDRDREGIKNLSSLIGKGALIRFLKNEGIRYPDDSNAEALLAGIGYTLDKERLIEIFDKNVDKSWDDLFPFVVDKLAVVKTENGFKLVDPKKLAFTDKNFTDKKEIKKDTQWTMPDFTGLPLRNAIERLNTKTARIRVFGSGFIIDQHPKPNEIVKIDDECILYGRTKN